jgi:M6 family metalloprotease-like protein
MTKLLLLLFVFLLAITPPLYAGPASPDPIEINQPDGSVISARINGDEFQAWTTTEVTGHTILHNRESGYWEYAEQALDGTLKLSGIRARRDDSAVPAGVRKGLRPPRDTGLERHMQQMRNEVFQQRLDSSAMDSSAAASGPADSQVAAAPGVWVPRPVSGSRKALIVLISFADRAIQTTPANWYSSVFDESAKSVARFYKDNSFGQITISPAAHSQPGNPVGVVSVTISDSHPDYGKNYVISTEQNILNHALAQAAPYVNFASFDTNGNGILEQSELTIYFIYAGYEASGTSKTPNVWAHAYWTTGTGITAGTKNVQRWAQSGELNSSSVQHPMGVIAHELGHALCGLPDLYDISGKNQAMGGFSLMSTGSWGYDSGEQAGTTPTSLDAWSREFLGWMTPVIPSASGQLSLGHVLESASSAYKLTLPTISATEYFLIENRQPVNWDRGLVRWMGVAWKGGLLILHIDNTAGSTSNNDINSYTANSTTPGHQGVVPVQANLSGCDMLTDGSQCAGKATTLFYSANNPSWTSGTSPNSNYYNGSQTKFSLTAISAPASTMTASFSLPAVPYVETDSVSAVTGSGARLNGTVNDNSMATTVSFEYGPTVAYGSTASGGIIPAASGYVAVSAMVGGLSCNAGYHYRLKGTNSLGTRYGNDELFSTTACLPGAPVIISATAGNGQANVYFTPPAYDGGTPITGYEVTPTPGQPWSGDSIPITVPGLQNGVAYTFVIRSINSAGTGSASQPSITVIPGIAVVSCSDAIGYQSFNLAYEAASDGCEIRLLDDARVDNFEVSSANSKGSVTITGGYDDAFLESAGLPAVFGGIKLSAGTTRLRNIVVRSQ